MKHTRLYKYQIEGVKRIQGFGGRCLLSDQQGLGKTIQALYWAWKYLPDDPPGPIVVVCPSSAKGHWEREALKHLGLRVEVLYGQSVPDYALAPTNPNQIYVLNYDILTQARRDGKRRDAERTWAYYLNALKPRLVIGDECHYVKTVSAARTKAFRKLCRGVPHVLLLSGTPLTNKPTDLWPALNILLPTEFPAFFPFATLYTNAFRAPWGWMYRGAKNLDQLHALLNRLCMVRRLKTDVLPDLPAKTRTVVPVEIDRREYAKAELDFLGWLAKESPGAAARARKAEEITRLNGLKQLVGRLKIPGVAAWIRDFFAASDEKLLLGATHRRVTHALVEEFKPFNPILVDGDCSDREKTAAFDRFNMDESCRLLVGNTQAAGVVWSCRATSKVALCELPWTPGECLQFEDRAHGLNRGVDGVPVEAYWLVAPDTIDSDLCDILERKAGWLDRTLDGGDTADGLDVHSQVVSLMKRRAS